MLINNMIFNYLSFVHSSNQCIAFPLQSHMWLHKQEQTTRHSRDTWRYICCCFLPWGHQCHHCAAYCGRWEDCLLPWKSSRDVLSPGLCICSSKPNLSIFFFFHNDLDIVACYTSCILYAWTPFMLFSLKVIYIAIEHRYGSRIPIWHDRDKRITWYGMSKAINKYA